MKKYLLVLLIAISVFSLSFISDKPNEIISLVDPVHKILTHLGEEGVEHEVRDDVPSNPKLGWQLVHKGHGAVGSLKSKKISRQFVCTSCHNVTKESDLFYNDPASKVDYSKRLEVPYTQGTTFWGIVNRTSYYNESRNDIREAIHLCAVQCSQGRELKDWEVESILAYFWELELKIGDLITNKELNDTPEEELAALLKSRYATGAPATFTKATKLDEAIVGNPESGAVIYNQGCLHCHAGKKYSYYKLDKSTKTFKFLKAMMGSNKKQDVHFITREGTLPTEKKSSYMPSYTIEKLGDQELADLVSYIVQEAED